MELSKNTQLLAIVRATLGISLAIADNVANVPESMQIIMNDKIIDWFQLSDPSSNHNAARRKHEPTTGDWLLRLESFVSWIERNVTSFWLHGIQGAGKTILCSTVIEHVKVICNLDLHKQYAYFYFDFNDPTKRTVDRMLRSVITHLALRRTQVLEPVKKLHNQCGNGNQTPERNRLVETLHSLLTSSDVDQIYLVIDALDECSERRELLDVISEILQQNVSLLMTSRRERDINDGLQDSIEVTNDLQGSGNKSA